MNKKRGKTETTRGVEKRMEHILKGEKKTRKVNSFKCLKYLTSLRGLEKENEGNNKKEFLAKLLEKI